MTSRVRSALLLVPPPVVYAAFFGAGVLLDRLVPWSPAWMRTELPRGIAWLLMIVAVGLGIASVGWLRWRRTTVLPHGQPTHLVTDGPYAMSRNPIYVALTCAYCAGAVLVARVWPLVFLVGPLLVMQQLIIPFEEQRMRAAFGERYEDYCRRVRRWI
jgi:protein-S-isoprenylcysteine O-methyltransferase Ste14